MALNKEQLRPDGYHEVNPGNARKWFKNQHNRYVRRESKNITKENPMANRYKGWAN